MDTTSEQQQFSLTIRLAMQTEHAGKSAFERIHLSAANERLLSVHVWPQEEGKSIRVIHVSFHRIAASSLPEAEDTATAWIYAALHGDEGVEKVTPHGLIIWED